MLSVSAHKMNGPKGVGLLHVKEELRLRPLLFGGEQERKRRAGTENVAAIVGFAKAVELSTATAKEKQRRYSKYQQLFIETFKEHELTFFVNGHPSERLPQILNVSFPGVSIESCSLISI